MGTKNQKKKKGTKGAEKATKRKHKAQKAAREDTPMGTYEVPDIVWESDTSAETAPEDVTFDDGTRDAPITLGNAILGAFVMTMFAVGTVTTCVLGFKIARYVWKMKR